MDPRFNAIVQMLKSQNSSLKDLAKMSGRDIFRFFNFADLRSLPFEDQDLTGLNFDGADLRGVSLGNIEFDPGAFNNAQLDDNLTWLKDEFVFGFDDILSINPNEILFFARFRPELIETIIVGLRVSYSRVSLVSQVSDASLRKARQSKVVALETSQAILRGLAKLLAESPKTVEAQFRKYMEQPCVSLLTGGNNSRFNLVDKESLDRLFEIRNARIRNQRRERPMSDPTYRDTAEFLRYFEHLIDRD